MTTDHEARANSQETEQLLRQALHQHAQRVEPSPDAFFKINQRIARKEEGFKLPAMLRVRLQPSMVASIVLLIALTVVTTLLLTRDDNSSQPVDIASTPSSVAPEPQENPPVSQPANPATDRGERGGPGEQEGQGRQESQGQPGSGEGQSEPGGQVVTGPAPANTPTSPPATSPPASTTPAPTAEESPTTDPPPPSDLAYAIRPLQVASKGQVIVYKDHDTSSEQLGVIPVSSEGGDYLATGIRATDYDGNNWSEVRLPDGETGWVGLETVAIVPAAFSAADESAVIMAGYHLLSIVAANESANEIESTGDEAAAGETAAPDIFLPNTSLTVSSRGVYVASVVGAGNVYGRYSPSEFLEAFGAEDAAETQPSVASLYSQLACLAGNADVVSGSVSDIAPPAAMQVLPYVAITSINPDNDCRVLVYFDYLRGQAEIIGFSVHN